MTPRQIELARHALGLTREKRSYRNRFCAGSTHCDYADWMEMVKSGDAKVQHAIEEMGGDSLFYMTPEGARKVLQDNESLCPEDFPQAA